MEPIRTAVLGFGTSGRIFHAPFIEADPRYRLEAIVTRNEARRAEAAARHPATRIVDDADALLRQAGELDLVVVGTPPDTHAALAHAFLDAGTGVLLDKPFTVTAREARELVTKAERLGLPLTAFQNRRWDGDFRTVRTLLARGALGAVWRFESRFERWRPDRPSSWKTETPVSRGGGMLYDLGSHLIDQALQLFGDAVPVYRETATRRDGGVADDDTFVVLHHETGVRSHLWMSSMAAQLGPRFRILGSAGAYTKYGLDPQEPALLSGAGVTDASFGQEPESAWGRLGIDGAAEPVPTEPGAYADFYAALAESLRGDAPLPVDPHDAVRVIELIEEIHRL
ncbi:Gfo/Idh/MocA family oxidoreductase [Amycolatopsis cynarae]|uniref:Gfo/Idh/MocA family oxidoreductase n=1 Tax=Amycolatopsis cynarae TaxID=2995223 RepID=A0ABY7B1P0_9PSEU|nr:Gfo/Idh/MocA family oxidoreductase [Amycolatopsis sp. HUAS 11-8]WAL65879.1 Gfo/Idh/MocA family oxidoreductase [Amycolatopsis sp. HUAS 11-8]